MFRFFRRYQKTMLVAAGILCMLAFTVGDALMQVIGSGGNRSQGADDVVVTWDGGQLTERQVSSLVQTRSAAMQYLAAIEQFGAAASPEDEVLRVLRFTVNPNMPNFERSTVNTYILAQQARAMGMELTDETVVRYLAALGRNKLGEGELRAIADNLSAGRPGQLSVNFLINAIREEMMAQLLQQSYRFAVNSDMPQQRYHDWVQANDEVFIEAAGIHAADSLVDVGEPSDEELRELYEEYKDVPDFPDMSTGVELPRSTPAFRMPRMVTLHYLQGNVDSFAERVKASITDEQVAAYYEENKAFYIKSVIDSEADSDDADGEMGSDEDADAAVGSEDDAAPDDAADSSAADATPPAETSPEEDGSDEPAEMEDAPGEGDGESTEDESETDSEAADPAATEEAAASEEGATAEATSEDTSDPQSSVGRSPFRLVALQETTDDGSAADDGPDDGPTEEEAATDDNSASDDSVGSADGNGADGNGAAETDNAEGDSGNDGATETSDEMPDESGSDDEPAGDAAEAAIAPTEYKPLEEVADEIRGTLARQQAVDEMKTAIDGAYDRLKAASRRYEKALLNAEFDGTPVPDPPEELTNLKPLAEEFGLVYEITEPVSQIEVRDDVPIGGSYESVVGNFSEASRMEYVVFGDTFGTYEPIKSETFDTSSSFITIKVADEPSRVPEFEEIRDQVVRAWKLRQAADLAEKRAEDLAERIGRDGVTLKEFFADQPTIKVVEPFAFAQVTAGDMAPMSPLVLYEFSQPEGIEAAGPGFVEKVFEAEAGDVLAVPNYNRSIFYIVRIKNYLQTEEQLREAFLREAQGWPGFQAMRFRRLRDDNQTFYTSLLESNNIDWKRAAYVQNQN